MFDLLMDGLKGLTFWGCNTVCTSITEPRYSCWGLFDPGQGKVVVRFRAGGTRCFVLVQNLALCRLTVDELVVLIGFELYVGPW